MTKENKKKVFIIAAIVAAFIVLLSFMRKRNGSGLVAGSNAPNPNTYYLTSNIPPLDMNGYAAPNFGPVTIGTGSGGGSGCNGCDVVTNFGNTSQLASYLNNSGGNYQQALNDALIQMGLGTDSSGGVISNLPVTAQ